MVDTKVVRILGANILCAVQQQAPAVVYELLRAVRESRAGLPVHLANAYTIACARSSHEVADVLRKDLSFADGAPLARLVRNWHANSGQVYGAQLMRDCFQDQAVGSLRHFVYGSSESVNLALAKHIQSEYPAAQIAGRYAPEFRDVVEQDRVDAVERFSKVQAEIIWVGLGTPKQDIECHAMSLMYPGVFIAVGAAFDFLPGLKKESPAWIRKFGFQWLHRLFSEPKRLWRRYLIGNCVFMLLALKDCWRQPKTLSLADWFSGQEF